MKNENKTKTIWGTWVVFKSLGYLSLSTWNTHTLAQFKATALLHPISGKSLRFVQICTDLKCNYRQSILQIGFWMFSKSEMAEKENFMLKFRDHSILCRRCWWQHLSWILHFLHSLQKSHDNKTKMKEFYNESNVITEITKIAHFKFEKGKVSLSLCHLHLNLNYMQL